MSRRKIDFGIDLGTTNSAICTMQDGESTIIKSMPMQKDTTPSCVAVSKRGSIQVGDKALNQLNFERVQAFKTNGEVKPNTYIEFKRTMGTDKKYSSSILEIEFSSEEFSAEILKALKNYVADEEVHSAVITVPAKFTSNQKDATRRAAKMAGIKQCELLPEPIAASMAYGIKSKVKDGVWVVFDFGGGTFDAALMKVEEGIIKVVDTDGDNHLGGKNLDFEIIDQVFLPYFKENFSISGILSDPKRKLQFRNMWKQKTEEAKIQLTMQEQIELLTDLGEDWGSDDEGVDFELDLTISRQDINKAMQTIFQLAIDITKELLNRNNLKGSDLSSLLLVGGPTYTPLLREMLADQITDVDTSIDPMTTVARGAALYASTLDIESEIVDQTKDQTKVQLDLAYEASSVEVHEFLTIKIAPDSTEILESNKLYVKASRSDGGWSSGKYEIDSVGDVIELQLLESKPNLFNITLYNEEGNSIPAEPNQITILQGSKTGSATLPYNYAVAIAERQEEKVIVKTIPGLEKNKSLPAVGTENDFKTQGQIRPGVAEDRLKIPIYQTEYDADGTRAIYNEHVYDIIITGNDLPKLLPSNSSVDLTIHIDRSELIIVEAYFPYLEHTTEIHVPENNVQKEIEISELEKEINNAESEIRTIGNSNPELLKQLEEIKHTFENNKHESDRKKEVLDRIRKVYRNLDKLELEGAWPKLETELREKFIELEKVQEDLGNEESGRLINDLKQRLNQVLLNQDIKVGKALLREIDALFYQITRIYQEIRFIRDCHTNFESINWFNPSRARQLVQQGIEIIATNPSVDKFDPIIRGLLDLMPQEEKSRIDTSLLTK